LQNQKNLGVSASRDIAIRYSSGTYITTLDGDDQMSPFKIQAELKVIKENNAAIAFSDIKVVGKDGARYLNTRKYHKKTHKQLLHLLLSRSAPVPRDMLIKKSIYEKTGGFLHGFNLFEDWMLKQKLAQFDGIHGWVHSGVVGTYYDRTNPGLSNRTQLQLLFAQLKVLAINVKIVQKYPENLYDALKVLSLLDKKKQCVNFHDFISLMENDLSMSEFCFKILVSLRQSLSVAPANNSADDAIINYIDSLFGRLR
jgi:glycosyltransferase involved in cell wall biosynthesis